MNNNFFVLGIYRHRINIDGNGIRTLIALSGCPLECKYCINEKIIKSNRYKIYTKESLLNEIMQDYCYFVSTNGGVTFGGGEPLLQVKQIIEFSKIIIPGISINIETSLNINFEKYNITILDIVENVSKLYIDIKDINSKTYHKYTGTNNINLIKNLKDISKAGLQHKCVIRIPLIKEFNNDDDIKKSCEYIKKLGFYNIDKFEYIIN